MEKRIPYIDMAKTIGLLCVILAHVTLPVVVSQARSFDVPLMVIVSAILANGSYSKYETQNGRLPGKDYFIKRFMRLVPPVWCMLCILIPMKLLTGEKISLFRMVFAFLLGQNGVGYFWIIMVYLVCAFMVPFLKKIDIQNKKHIFAVLLIFIVHEIVCELEIGTTIKYFDDTILYIVPYGCMTLLGLNYERISKKGKRWIILCSAIVYIAISVFLYIANGEYVRTENYKYPVRLYYFSFAIAGALSVLELLSIKQLRIYKSKVVCFISQASLWIYLWHTVWLLLVRTEIWWLRFLLVTVLSCATAYLQRILVKRLEKTKINKTLLGVLKT